MAATIEGYGVLVTGGGSGIGEGCALALARDGAVVTICGRTADKLDAAAARIRDAAPGAGVHTIVADVTDEDQVEAAVTKSATEAGGLHGVVASAGGSLHMGPLVLADADAVRATLDLNIMGTFLTLKHSAPLLAGTKGSFVGVSSHAGLDTFRFLGAYGAAKAGLDHLVRVAADELGPSRVRVNSVRPGIIDNELMQGITGGGPVLDSYLEEIPLHRVGTRRGRRRARPLPRRPRVELDHGAVHQRRRWPVGAQGRRLRLLRADGPRRGPTLEHGRGAGADGAERLMDVEGTIAVVTGGASGIGRATALELARRGARGVVLADINDARLAEAEDEVAAAGARVLTVHCDVACDEDVEHLRDAAFEEFGDVDIIMNNAGVAMLGPADLLTMEEWDWILQINLYGVIRGVRAFVPHLRARAAAGSSTPHRSPGCSPTPGTRPVHHREVRCRGPHRGARAVPAAARCRRLDALSGSRQHEPGRHRATLSARIPRRGSRRCRSATRWSRRSQGERWPTRSATTASSCSRIQRRHESAWVGGATISTRSSRRRSTCSRRHPTWRRHAEG